MTGRRFHKYYRRWAKPLPPKGETWETFLMRKRVSKDAKLHPRMMRLLEQLASLMHLPGYTDEPLEGWWGKLTRQRKRAILRELRARGLVKYRRTKWHTNYGSNRIEITPEGRKAFEEGRVGEKPLPRTQRKEKWSRHV